MPPALSIILPTYEGGKLLRKHLPSLVAYIASLPFTTEIIIVDDGSQDRGLSQSIAEEFECRYLENVQNDGKGSAVRKGMLAAKGDVHLFTDSDIPYSFEYIRAFYEAIHDQGMDIAIGNRDFTGSDYFEKIPPIRKFVSRLFTLFVSALLQGKKLDTQCGLKAFHKDASRAIFGQTKINRFAFDVEVLLIALKRGYTIHQIPVTLRIWEASGINVPREGIRMIVDLFRIQVNNWRGEYS